jgi:hypothetical protein
MSIDNEYQKIKNQHSTPWGDSSPTPRLNYAIKNNYSVDKHLQTIKSI